MAPIGISIAYLRTLLLCHGVSFGWTTAWGGVAWHIGLNQDNSAFVAKPSFRRFSTSRMQQFHAGIRQHKWWKARLFIRVVFLLRALHCH